MPEIVPRAVEKPGPALGLFRIDWLHLFSTLSIWMSNARIFLSTALPRTEASYESITEWEAARACRVARRRLFKALTSP